MPDDPETRHPWAGLIDAGTRLLLLIRPADRTEVVILAIFAILAAVLLGKGPPVMPGAALGALGLFALLVLSFRRSWLRRHVRWGLHSLVLLAACVGVAVAVAVLRGPEWRTDGVDTQLAWKIQGHVLSASAQPLFRVRVRLYGDKNVSDPTDRTGFFQLYVPEEMYPQDSDSADFFVLFRSGARQTRAHIRGPTVTLRVPGRSPAFATAHREVRPQVRLRFAGHAREVDAARAQDTTYVYVRLQSVVAEHDGTGGPSAWEFLVMTNGDTIKLNRTAYEDREGGNVMLTPGYVVARVLPGQRMRVAVEGNRFLFLGTRVATGRLVLDPLRLQVGREYPYPVTVMVDRSPTAGRFTFNFRVTRQATRTASAPVDS